MRLWPRAGAAGFFVRVRVRLLRIVSISEVELALVGEVGIFEENDCESIQLFFTEAVESAVLAENVEELHEVAD